MEIKSISIESIGGIRELHIGFNPNINFICGPNGIGKTTILECVAHSFSYQSTEILKRSAVSEFGTIKPVIIEVDGKDYRPLITVKEFSPEKNTNVEGAFQLVDSLLFLKTARLFRWQNLEAVVRDKQKTQYNYYSETKTGINFKDIKNWFVNRYLYSSLEGTLTKTQITNFRLAKTCFSALNKDFVFSRVEASSNEIMIKTPTGEIYFEYLSSGFKSCLSLLIGIIKEIEYRFKEPTVAAEDFDGIVLIDELDLHLHPEWQSIIAKTLIAIFPKVQFITTTHSPHIIQSAKPEEIIALAENNGDVYQRSFEGQPYGFQGWTVEEVLTDVMGMQDTRTEIYKEALEIFEKAIEKEDYEMAKRYFLKLDKLLHPHNHFRKILSLELASIKEADE